MKKKKKVNIYKNDNRRFLLVLVMVICIFISMLFYWVYAYHHKYGVLPIDYELINFKPDYYVNIKGDTVYLENITDDIRQDFLDSQREILEKKILDMDITKGIYNNILSVKISYLVSEVPSDFRENLTINVDLKKKRVINSEELIEKVGSSYKKLAEDIFEEYIKLSDTDDMVTDAISDKSMSSEEFNQNREKYIIRIREKLPDVMKIYIEDNKLYGSFNLMEINNVCYYTNNDTMISINKEIGQL